MWDITCARGLVNGLFFCLYLFINLYDRSVVGWGLQREESAEHAAQLSAPSAWTTAAFARSLWSCIQTTGGETPLRAQVPRGPAAALMLAALVDLGITAPSPLPASAMTIPTPRVCSEPSKPAMTIPRQASTTKSRSALALRPPSAG